MRGPLLASAPAPVSPVVRLKAGTISSGEDGECCAGCDPFVADHEPCPGGPAAARVILVPNARPVDAWPDAAEDGGEQRQRDRDGDDRNQHAADADAPHGGHRQHDQRDEADADRQPREEYGSAGGRDGGDDGVLVVAALGPLLAPAGDQQQRVVDRDAEADERDQELDDRGDVRDVAEAEDDQEGREDRERRDQQRDQREQRGEDEGKDGERSECAEERLGEDAGPLLRAAGAELVQAGDRAGVAARAGCAPGCGRRSSPRAASPNPFGAGAKAKATVVLPSRVIRRGSWVAP